MSDPRKHHTVSQGYLRFFADEDDRLWEYRKPTGTSVRKRVAEVAAERDFYAIEKSDGTLDQAVEKALSKIETIAVGALRRLTSDEPLRKTDRGDIAYFIALQFIRTTSFRRMMAMGISTHIRAMRAFLSQNPTRQRRRLRALSDFAGGRLQ
jgi:hypothetical protein